MMEDLALRTQLETLREEILRSCCWTFTARCFGVHGGSALVELHDDKTLNASSVFGSTPRPAAYHTEQFALSGIKQRRHIKQQSRAERVPAGIAAEEDRAPWLDVKGSSRTKEKEAPKIRHENKLINLFKNPQTLSTEHERFWGALVKVEMRAPCNSLISYVARTGERDKDAVLTCGFPWSIAMLGRTETTTRCPG